MDESNVPRLTEAAIRQLADDQSFERGLDYYASGAVQEPVHRGNELRGMCYGSRDEPYRVEVVLGEDMPVSPPFWMNSNGLACERSQLRIGAEVSNEQAQLACVFLSSSSGWQELTEA